MSAEICINIAKELRKREYKNIRSIFWNHDAGDFTVYYKIGQTSKDGRTSRSSFNVMWADKTSLKQMVDDVINSVDERLESKSVSKPKKAPKKEKSLLKKAIGILNKRNE